MEETANKVVYLHRRKDNLGIFYVGMGEPLRPYNFKSRTQKWFDTLAISGYTVEIVQEGLTSELAFELEALIIETIGLKNLANMQSGHSLIPVKKYGKTGRTLTRTNEDTKKLILQYYSDGTYKTMKLIDSLCGCSNGVAKAYIDKCISSGLIEDRITDEYLENKKAAKKEIKAKGEYATKNITPQVLAEIKTIQDLQSQGYNNSQIATKLGYKNRSTIKRRLKAAEVVQVEKGLYWKLSIK